MLDATSSEIDLNADPLRATLKSEQAEAAFLGALLMNSGKLAESVPYGLTADSFYEPINGEIFSAIKAIGFGSASLLSVSEAIQGSYPGSRSYVSSLLSSGIVSMLPDQVRGFGELVVNFERKRALLDAANGVRSMVEHETSANADAMVAQTMARLEEISASSPATRGPISLFQAADAAINAGEARGRGERSGLVTGFPSIDGVLGGMDPGTVHILAARPAMGKTALGLQIALNAAEQGVGVCVISLEMQAAQLGRRALALKSGVPQFRIREGNWSQRDADALVSARKAFYKTPMTIEDQGGLNVQMIGLRAKAAKRKHGLGLLVVDHMHIVGEPENVGRNGPTWAMKQISNGLKRISKELEVPVLALAQLNRGVEGRDDKRPNMSDLRQSGDIEQDAESVMMLYRPEYYLGKSAPERGERQTAAQHETAVANWHESKQRLAGKTEVIFEKVRDGSTGTVEMTFDGSRTCFKEAGNE